MLRIAIWTLLLNTCTEVLGTDPLYCLNCQHVTSPKHCHSVAVCRNGEACFMEKYVNSAGEILFNLGCHGNQICNNSISQMSDHRGKRQNIISSHSSSSTCLSCCKGNLCNAKGCGDDGYPTTRGPICFNCPQSTDPQKCDLIQACDRNEKCLIDAVIEFGEVVYSSKCSPVDCFSNEVDQVFGKRQLFKRSQRRTCRSCCSTDLCNNKCNNDNITSQNQIARTTTPVSSGSSSIASAKVDTGHAGREYIICFPESTGNLTLAEVLITTIIDTVVYIESPHPEINKTVNVTAARGVRIRLPTSIMLRGNAIEQKGVRISAPVDIGVYVYSRFGRDGESYSAIPTKNLATFYYGAAFYHSFISIVALDDNTRIKLTVQYPTQSYNGRNYTYGDTVVVYLSRLSTFQIKGNPYLYNTNITSDKPIGVISGSTCTFSTNCNYAVEYVPPVSSLGRRFIVPPFLSTGISGFYIFTDIKKLNVIATSKNFKNTFPSTGYSSFELISDTPYKIETDKAGVMILYFKKANDSAILPSAKITIPAISQYSNNFKYLTPSSSVQHFVTIIIKSEYVLGLRFDNRTIYSMNPDLQAIIAQNSLYNVISLNVGYGGQHTAHHLDKDVRFGMIAYGLNRRSSESYGFPVGLRL